MAEMDFRSYSANRIEAPLLYTSAGDPLRTFRAAIEHGFKSGMEVANLYDNTGDYVRALSEKAGSYFDKMMLGEASEPILVDGEYIEQARLASKSVMTNSATQAFSVILENIVKNHGMDEGDKPVIIFPTPTYGVFTELAEGAGFEVVTLPKDKENNWRVDSEKLNALTEKLNSIPGKKVMAYYDSNPNNPTGKIRSDEEAIEVANVIKKHPNIAVIDDAVYHGTEYDKSRVGEGMFAKKDILPGQTYTIFGGSKIGLTGLRAGLIYTSCQHAWSERDKNTGKPLGGLDEIVKNRTYFVNPFTAHALSFAFNTNPEQQKISSEFLESTAQEYKENSLLIKAMINGLDKVDLSEDQQSRFVRIISDALKIGEDEAINRLQKGVSGASIITEPEAGFFHLLDFSETQGKFYDAGLYNHIISNSNEDCLPETLPAAQSSEGYAVKVNNPLDVIALLSHFKMLLCTPDFMRLDDKKDPLFRFTYAIEEEDIVKVVNRLDLAMSKLTDSPETVVPVSKEELQLQQMEQKTPYLV